MTAVSATLPAEAPVKPGSRARVLVIGASGQLGRVLCSDFQSGYDLIAANHQHVQPGDERVDLADAATVRSVWQKVAPDIVLLAGCMCNVDGCEMEPDRCYRVNAGGAQAVAEQARATGSFVVFFSTDHVFDGLRDSYRETDPVSPINVYSRSKVEAEEHVRRMLPGRHLILRTSSVYGFDVHRRNFVTRVVDTLAAGNRLVVPDDQWGSPTFTDDLARAAKFLVECGERGTFHATGPEFVSRETFARSICERFGLDASLIIPRPTATLGQAARRPRGVRLDCGKLTRAGVPAFRGIDAGLACLRNAMGISAEAR